MHWVSVSGVGNSAIELMYFGTSWAWPIKNSKAVAVNAVAVICLKPLKNTSAVVPFHLMAILQVSAVVVNKPISLPATRLDNDNLKGPWFLNTKPFVAPVFVSARNKVLTLASLVKTRLFLISTNQVPPLAVISPLVKMLPLLITSAFRVTEADVVGMYDVA